MIYLCVLIPMIIIVVWFIRLESKISEINDKMKYTFASHESMIVHLGDQIKTNKKVNAIENTIRDFREYMKSKDYSKSAVKDYGNILRHILSNDKKNQPKYKTVENVYNKYLQEKEK